MISPHRALILVDVQREYADGPLSIRYPSLSDSLPRILDVVEAATAAGLPIAVVRHELPEGAPVFAAGSEGARLHPEIEAVVGEAWQHSSKEVASIFSDDELLFWLREEGVEVVTLVGFMTNNCILGSAADAERTEFSVEVIRDATGAIDLANEAGSVSAQQVHETLMVVLQSNFAAVTTTDDWTRALETGLGLQRSNLVASATGHISPA